MKYQRIPPIENQFMGDFKRPMRWVAFGFAAFNALIKFSMTLYFFIFYCNLSAASGIRNEILHAFFLELFTLIGSIGIAMGIYQNRKKMAAVGAFLTAAATFLLFLTQFLNRTPSYGLFMIVYQAISIIAFLLLGMVFLLSDVLAVGIRLIPAVVLLAGCILLFKEKPSFYLLPLLGSCLIRVPMMVTAGIAVMNDKQKRRLQQQFNPYGQQDRYPTRSN